MILGFEELRGHIQDALDELCSPRTSSEVKTGALERLEKQIAASCPTAKKKDEHSECWDHFLALQYTFECNVPSRLLNWISVSTAKLEQAVNKGAIDDERVLASQLARALCIIQGVVLSHSSSKAFLSRKYSLEIILELLLASRHITSPLEDDRASSLRDKQLTSIPLTSTVLDTLLCILVDAPEALRLFESAHGVQAVVKILKRAGTPREVRMKCLEFLYFYLLDETGSPDMQGSSRSPPTSPVTPTSAMTNLSSYPGTPSLQPTHARLPKPSLNSTPLRPLSRHGSGSSSATTSSSSSRSASSSSSHSSTSISSVSTPTSSTPTSPEKIKMQQFQSSFRTPVHSSQSSLKFPNSQPHRHPMMMLKKEFEYEPLSPRKHLGVGEGFRTPRTPSSRSRAQTHGQFHTPSRGYTHSSRLSISSTPAENDLQGSRDSLNHSQSYTHTSRSSIDSIVFGMEDWKNSYDGDSRKTTEEKKQFLGTMLGNVDALVEGVRKAGVWGLG